VSGPMILERSSVWYQSGRYRQAQTTAPDYSYMKQLACQCYVSGSLKPVPTCARLSSFSFQQRSHVVISMVPVAPHEGRLMP